jgi:hypothetical protein
VVSRVRGKAGEDEEGGGSGSEDRGRARAKTDGGNHEAARERAAREDGRGVRVADPAREHRVGRERRRVEREEVVGERGERREPGEEAHRDGDREVRAPPWSPTLDVRKEGDEEKWGEIDDVALERAVGLERRDDAGAHEREETGDDGECPEGALRARARSRQEIREAEDGAGGYQPAGGEGKKEAREPAPADDLERRLARHRRPAILPERDAAGHEHRRARRGEDGDRQRVGAKLAPVANEHGDDVGGRKRDELGARSDGEQGNGQDGDVPAA